MKIAKAGITNAVHKAAPLIGGVAGVGAFWTQLTLKDQSIFNNPNKVYVALNFLGKLGVPTSILNAIAPANLKGQFYAQMTFNAFGWLNNFTLTGAGLIIADYILREVGAGKYGYNYIAPLIRSVGYGNLVGGVAGGILDDPEGGHGNGHNGTRASASVVTSSPSYAASAPARTAGLTSAAFRGSGLP